MDVASRLRRPQAIHFGIQKLSPSHTAGQVDASSAGEM